jgi:hypothetical protein
MIESCLKYCKGKIDLSGFYLTADNAYCVEAIFQLVKDSGLIFVTRPKSNYSFHIKTRYNSLSYLAKKLPGNSWKFSSLIKMRYVKKKAYHQKYKHCTLLFYEIVHADQVVIKYLIANTRNIRADSIFNAFKKRWGIEVFFRNLKQVIGFSNYSGRFFVSVRAHYFLRLLTAIIVEITIQLMYEKYSAYDEHVTYGELRSFLSQEFRISCLL